MKICINAGHTVNGPGSGVVGIKNESIENRRVAKEVIRLLKEYDHEVIDSTIDKASSKEEYLRKCVYVANKSNCDLFVSIHFNAFDNVVNGTEVLIYNNSSKCREEANRVCDNISKLGFKNRGIKNRPDLYVLKNTNMPALIIECCFIDSEIDMKVYNVDYMAKAIVFSLLNKNMVNKGNANKIYRVCIGSFENKDNAIKMVKKIRNNGYDDAFIV